MRLTKGLETSSSITVPFTTEKHRNLQHNTYVVWKTPLTIVKSVEDQSLHEKAQISYI
jgi:hypothetical protein